MRYKNNVAWRPTGFAVTLTAYNGEVLMQVTDLNPETHIKQVFSRRDLARLAWWLLTRAIKGV